MADLDPETFDITQWLAGADPDEYRNRETVTVYLIKDGLKDELDKVRAQHDEAVVAEKANGRQKDLAVGESRRVTLLENRMTNLIEEVQSTRREVVLTGLIGPEITEAAADLKGHERDYALIARSARILGKPVDVNAIRLLHKMIGEAQWADIVEAYKRVTYGKPGGGITAPFSPRS
ncbi:hypothetical protein ABDK96_02095 [Citricoccus nitrophenolicus]|uniref:Uncharacterized protein n=1 Tax=Citricoccus nitrophenolicus TaxID=863575 RepID=A0ABV0IE95_9MICC